MAYQMPGPGSVAKFIRHLLPVRKNTFEKSGAKREPPRCLAVQFCFANTFSLPSLRKAYRALGLEWVLKFQMPVEMVVIQGNCGRSMKDMSDGFSPKHDSSV